MAGLADWLSKSSEIIELGVIKEREGGQVYTATISGVEKRVFNTLNTNLSVGNRVLISKLHSGKRYILSNTGFSGDYNNSITTEVTIDG